MHLKGCLHTHTTCSDGRLSPQEVADAYDELGYDFVAFTDHDYLWKPGQENAYAAIRTRMLVFVGMELTVFERGYLHVNRIGGDSCELHVFNHAMAYDLDLEQVLDRIASVGRRFPLDAVEVTDKGFLRPDLDLSRFPLPAVASDDAHERGGIGRAWIEMDAPRDRDAILRAVKNGDFWNCWARGSRG
ncbi:MAG: PHP domain-containing protein [Acidobacteriota bacterium]